MDQGQRGYSLLHGLSDFWIRFFSDTGELKAFYAATETQLAQAYLELFSAFLGLSLADVALFSREYFRLIKIREDQLIYRLGAAAGQERFFHTLNDPLVRVQALQNKVYAATAVLAQYTDFDLDAVAYELQFMQDVTGQVGREIGRSNNASLLTYGTGALAELYVTEGTPFQDAQPGSWVQLTNSTVGNNRSFRIDQVIDAQRVLLNGSPTLPDPASGALTAVVLDSRFIAVSNFATRALTIATGGTFDDAVYRQSATEQQSWAAPAPLGLDIRKGDLLRVLDHEAVPVVPSDYTIAVVRHDRLHLASTTPVPVNMGPRLLDTGRLCTVDTGNNWVVLLGHLITKNTKLLFVAATLPSGLTPGEFVYARDITANTFRVAANPGGAAITLVAAISPLTVYLVGEDRSTKLVRSYVILREPADPEVLEAGLLFAETGVPKSGVTGSFIEDPVTLTPCFNVTTGLVGPFAASDKQRFITLSNCLVDITATCEVLEIGNRITWVPATTPVQPFARCGPGSTITVTGSTNNQNGDYVVESVEDNGNTVIVAGSPLKTESFTVQVNDVSNDGTYQIRQVDGTGRKLFLDQPFAYPDVVGAANWRIHDGYREQLAHTRVQRGSLIVTGGIGSIELGGYRQPIEGVDYQVDYELGELLQIGRFAGTWSIVAITTRATYRWWQEVFPAVTSSLATLRGAETEVEVNEVAFWAPDVQVDNFHLYDNFGYLINRFQPSSETYRQFIRGVFQLYLLGPTLGRIESALNIICSMPVIRDDGEVLTGYDPTSDADHLLVTTRRPNGDTAVYQFPLGTPLRDDITSYDPLTSAAVTFLAFEPLTTLFQVTDYVQDPLWWDSIVLPQEIMPLESTWRRTTVPEIFEHVIGQIDEPHIGDPGLFIGADEDGVVPSWADIPPVFSPGTLLAFPFAGVFGGSGWSAPSSPVKRRKMANIVVDKYVKRNLFYVHFDIALASLFPASFIQDLRELVLITKPGYALAYVEPTNSFHDTMRLGETTLQLHADLTLQDPAVLLIGGPWSLGDFWRITSLVDQALLVADGLTIPAPVALPHVYLTNPRVHCGAAVIQPYSFDGAGALVPAGYSLDQLTGLLTPLTVWPAGIYTIDYDYNTQMPSGTMLPGDVPFVIGGYSTPPLVIHDLVVQDS